MKQPAALEKCTYQIHLPHENGQRCTAAEAAAILRKMKEQAMSNLGAQWPTIEWGFAIFVDTDVSPIVYAETKELAKTLGAEMYDFNAVVQKAGQDINWNYSGIDYGRVLDFLAAHFPRKSHNIVITDGKSPDPRGLLNSCMWLEPVV